jgi:hypothetical protein
MPNAISLALAVIVAGAPPSGGSSGVGARRPTVDQAFGLAGSL